MEIHLLGPLEVRGSHEVIALPRRQQRALLAALALRAGEVVSTDRLIADLWGERAPASATGSLQNTVSALRKLIGRDVLLTQAPGYRLAVARDAVDCHRFERLLEQAREEDAPVRARLLREALGLWRGPALADFEEEEFARLEASRLDELRVEAQEERVDAELTLGRHAALVGELEQLVGTHPLRERLRGQLMLALYRCGRHAEALEVYRAARLALADELGLDPSRDLQELERRVLRQDPELAAPTALAEESQTQEPTELQLVTVLAAVPPVDEDPERHRRHLDETLRVARTVLDRYGGVLERFGPEGLVAVFGADAPSDDDAVRAVMSARELGLPCGVATGEVLRGAGAVVTRAVELARVGGIRLDERTAAIVGFERRFHAALVGRNDELERLRSALGAARQSRRCRVVTVVGDPGVGKTRLARELAVLEAARATVLVAPCLAHGDGATFLPLLGALRHVDPEQVLAGEDDAELVLARLNALSEGGQVAPLGESYWAVRRLLEALARTQPVLLVLDDAHWAEPALVDLVDYLGDRADGPMLVLCLARPEVERAMGARFELGPLDPDETRAVVAGSAEVDSNTAERIAELSEGNALFAEQLAIFAAQGGEGLPPTLESVLAGRLGRLDPSDRVVLQRAAVLGREFSLAAVAWLTREEVARELLALTRTGFVHPAAGAEPGDDGYSFHHVLLRDAAYAGLTKFDRAELHQRAAAWIDREGRGDDAIAGYHLEQAVRHRRALGEDADELAAVAGDRLGDAAMKVWRTNDVSAAVGLLGRAATLLPAGSRRAELEWERSIALRLHGRLDESKAALDRAEADASASRATAIAHRVTAERAYLQLSNGELALADALAIFDGAAEGLRALGDARGFGRAQMHLGNLHLLAGRYEEVLDAAARAEGLYAEAGFSPAVCLGVQAESLFYGPRPIADALRECAVLHARCTDRAASAWVTAVLGALHALEGRCDEGRSLLDHARTVFEDLGAERALRTVWTPLAVEHALLEADETAEAAARSSFEALRGADDAAYASTHAVQLAEIVLERGDANESDDLCRFAELHALDSDVIVQFRWRSVRARLLARSRDLVAAERFARDAVAIASLTDGLRDSARAHFALAEVLGAAERNEEARAADTAGIALLREKGATALVSRHASLSPAER